MRQYNCVILTKVIFFVRNLFAQTILLTRKPQSLWYSWEYYVEKFIAVCIYRLVMISIDLSETAQKSALEIPDKIQS